MFIHQCHAHLSVTSFAASAGQPHLTPSLHYVAVLAWHPDLPERVLRELPRMREVFVVEHCWMRDVWR